MIAPPVIRLNADPEIRTQRIIGDQFCVIIDDFLEDPRALIEYAWQHAREFRTTPRGYPGPMLNLPEHALTEFHRFIRFRMSGPFGFLRGNARMTTGLTMTTLPPAELANFQRLCHTDPRDAPDRRRCAALVYLFENEDLGGTAFYRWRDVGLVNRALALELQDPAAAAALLAEHTGVFRRPPCYLTESNELAERVAVIPARFNRMIFYSGEIPHSGHITRPELLSTDFRKGRLTLNCFASVVPR